MTDFWDTRHDTLEVHERFWKGFYEFKNMSVQKKTFIWGYVIHSLSKSRFSQGTLDEFATMHTGQALARFFVAMLYFGIFSIIHL